MIETQLKDVRSGRTYTVKGAPSLARKGRIFTTTMRPTVLDVHLRGDKVTLVVAAGHCLRRNGRPGRRIAEVLFTDFDHAKRLVPSWIEDVLNKDDLRWYGVAELDLIDVPL